MSTLIATGCGTPERSFQKLADEFVYSTLTFSPISATAAGLHQYQGQNLDEQLDDMSPAALDHHREYYQRFRDRLQNEVKPDSLSAEDRADFHIMQDQVALALLDYEETQSYLHNPTLYVEMAGNALFTPLTLEYAPLDARIRHIIGGCDRHGNPARQTRHQRHNHRRHRQQFSAAQRNQQPLSW